MDSKKNWHLLSVNETSQKLGADLSKGLDSQEVGARQKKYGLNQLEEKKKINPWLIFLSQFDDFIIWTLLGAALISGFLSAWVDSVAICLAVLLQAGMSFIQEYRAEKSLAALKKLAAPNSKVLRDGHLQVIPSKELVPGDIVTLEAGDHIPADLRLAETTYLKTLESSITGESVPVEKETGALEGEAPLGDRINSAFMGTTVTSGRGKGIVVETGMQTELGNIAGLIQNVEEGPTPLQKRLEKFGKSLVYVCLGAVAVVFFLELRRSGSLLEPFMLAVSLAVAAIPEGLPAVVTVALSVGVRRMSLRHVLIRRLSSVETLGSTSVICSDKTGTLTQNEMTVQKVWVNGAIMKVSGGGYAPKGDFILNGAKLAPEKNPELKKALTIAALCNTAALREKSARWEIVGDPTEGALLTAAAKADIWKSELEKEHQWKTEIPFDADRKRMSSIYNAKDGLTLYIKGAPDIVLKECDQILLNGSVAELTAKERERILADNARLAGEALRVLAVAYRPINEVPKHNPEALEQNLIFVGLIAMIDPARPEVKDAVEKCRKAGIRVVMITGDHKETAIAIAKALGFFKDGDKALSGGDIDQLAVEEFERDVDKIAVYARVSAEHKLKIVRALKKKGAIVAMTGDGVNDAPAVKEADVGVAMGITGTEVTKEASDMVITDDNFASIVAAVEEGRGIYNNIKKSVYFLLSCNSAGVMLMLFASLLGLPMPLFPIQILWINLVIDGLPALALGVDPISPTIMQEPARNPREGIFTRPVIMNLLWEGLLMAIVILAGFMYALKTGDLKSAQAIAFTIRVVVELFHVYNCRSETQSIFGMKFFSNMKLTVAVAISLILQLMIYYIAPLRAIFKTQSLSLQAALFAIALSLIPVLIIEATKAVKRKRSQQAC